MRMVRMCLTSVAMVLAANVALAQVKLVREISEPQSGVTVSLPRDWNVAAGKNGLLAAPEDKRAFVILFQTKDRFEEAVWKLRASLRGDVFRDVEVEKMAILVEKDRGGYEAAVVFEGKAVMRKDGAPARFAGIVVKSGEKGGLVFGAWKDAAHAKEVRAILDGVKVRMPGGKGGLILRNRKTGASIQLPEHWGVLAGRKGLLAAANDKQGMVIIAATPESFEGSIDKVRAHVSKKALDGVKLGEFEEYAVDDGVGLTEVRVARGKAKDRKDDSPVEFAVVVAELVKGDGGILVLGIWKNKEQHEHIKKMMRTLKLR